MAEKSLAGRPETTCLSVNDINSKRCKQPVEVEHSSCISSRNSPGTKKQNKAWKKRNGAIKTEKEIKNDT